MPPRDQLSDLAVVVPGRRLREHVFLIVGESGHLPTTGSINVGC